MNHDDNLSATEVLTRLSELSTVEVSIFRFVGKYEDKNWIVNFKYSDEGTEVKISESNFNWEQAIESAWVKLWRVMNRGVGSALLMALVDHRPPDIASAQADPNDDIPF